MVRIWKIRHVFSLCVKFCHSCRNCQEVASGCQQLLTVTEKRYQTAPDMSAARELYTEHDNHETGSKLFFPHLAFARIRSDSHPTKDF